MSDQIPYFKNVNDWVNSLPYGKPLYEYKGENQNGYVYGNPFESRYGVYPTTVYGRLFKTKQHYIISAAELTELRSTIQYFPVYLDDSYEKISNFLKERGFICYRKEGKRGDLIHSYFKRNNISLYLCNQTTPQDYIPNTIVVEIAELIRNTKTDKVKRRQVESFAHIPVLDELGKKTVECFEQYLKKSLKEEKIGHINTFSKSLI